MLPGYWAEAVFVTGVPSIIHNCEFGRVKGSHVTTLPSCIVATTL
jgi:hypothetical protein